MQVELNKKVQNPFYGMRKTLELMQRTANAVNPRKLWGSIR